MSWRSLCIVLSQDSLLELFLWINRVSESLRWWGNSFNSHWRTWCRIEEKQKERKWKVAGLNDILTEVWKTRKCDDILLWLGNTVYKHISIEKWTKGCILFFLKKGYFRISKNYKGITVTLITANVYNVLLLNHIQPEIENILRKIRMT